MGLLENRATVEVIGRMTLFAAIDHQLAAPRLSKEPRLGRERSTFRTLKPLRVEVLGDPLHTAFIIQEVGNWKFHASSLALLHTFQR